MVEMQYDDAKEFYECYQNHQNFNKIYWRYKLQLTIGTFEIRLNTLSPKTYIHWILETTEFYRIKFHISVRL